MKTILLCLVLASACIVGDPGTGTETGESGGGGGGGGGGTGGGAGTMDQLVDGGMGSGSATCTGALYDPCSDPTQCQSGNCHLFAGAGIQVCTQTCTVGDNTTCPMQNGQPTQCNGMGICRPDAANACVR